MNITDKPLVILEMANNHNGNVRHGLRIVEEFKKITDPFTGIFDFAVKLQLRSPSIVHPDYVDRMDISQIKRFTDTRLSETDFRILKTAIEEHGFISMCTPFDEPSIAAMLEMKFAMFKVASCSFGDWPLMEALEPVDRPIILSTACAGTALLDRVISFFQNRKKHIALMHCISSYPTANHELAVNQISYLKQRYGNIPIGFSTHEPPDNYQSIGMAIAAGARIFEKHAGIPDDGHPLNQYSCTPLQIQRWLSAAKDAFEMYGNAESRMAFSAGALRDLCSFTRAAFAKRDIKAGERFSAHDMFLAIPGADCQLRASDMSKYAVFTARKDILKQKPVFMDDVEIDNPRDKVAAITREALAMINEAKVALPNGVLCSISAHYGIERFDEYGAVIVDVLNREYCKKLIIMRGGQKHPAHTHVKKEETFQVLYGSMTVTLNGAAHNLGIGQLLTVGRGQKHAFATETGVIFEEISTTHFAHDSIYEDSAIMDSGSRKINCRLFL